MDERLKKMFEESRKRHSKQEEKRNKKKEVVKRQPTETELKVKKAKTIVYRYNYIDKQRFGTTGDLDYKWVIKNIFNHKCTYCEESDWKKLGCDRIDNNKPHTKDNCICACGRCNVLRGDKFSVEDMKEIGAVIKKIEKRNTVFKVAKKKGKQVAKIDGDGNVIKIYPSITETAVDGYNRAC